jgi:hypothetical protein
MDLAMLLAAVLPLASVLKMNGSYGGSGKVAVSELRSNDNLNLTKSLTGQAWPVLRNPLARQDALASPMPSVGISTDASAKILNTTPPPSPLTPDNCGLGMTTSFLVSATVPLLIWAGVMPGMTTAKPLWRLPPRASSRNSSSRALTLRAALSA